MSMITEFFVSDLVTFQYIQYVRLLTGFQNTVLSKEIAHLCLPGVCSPDGTGVEWGGHEHRHESRDAKDTVK